MLYLQPFKTWNTRLRTGGYSLFLSRAGEALFSLGWQSPRDGVSIKILVPITSLGWRQEGHPAYKKICLTLHRHHQMIIPVQRMLACKTDVKPNMMMISYNHISHCHIILSYHIIRLYYHVITPYLIITSYHHIISATISLYHITSSYHII